MYPFMKPPRNCVNRHRHLGANQRNAVLGGLGLAEHVSEIGWPLQSI